MNGEEKEIEEHSTEEVVDPVEVMKAELADESTEEEENPMMTRRQWHEYVLTKMRKEDDRAFDYIHTLYKHAVEVNERRKKLTLRIIDKVQEYYEAEILSLKEKRKLVKNMEFKPDVDLEKFLEKNSPGYVTEKDEKSRELLEKMKKIKEEREKMKKIKEEREKEK